MNAAPLEYRLVYHWPNGSESVMWTGSAPSEFPYPRAVSSYIEKGWKLESRQVTDWEDVSCPRCGGDYRRLDCRSTERCHAPIGEAARAAWLRKMGALG